MSPPLSWFFIGLAIAAAIVGILAGADYAIAVPAALIAIAAGGVAFASLSEGPSPRIDGIPARPETPAFGVRAWFSEGSLGREEIVLLLDRIDRSGPHPELPARPPAELRRLVRLPVREFRRYVGGRLDELESGR